MNNIILIFSPNMNPETTTDFEVTMLIEIPYGSNVKYEIKHNQLLVDRVLHHRSVHYPFNYGFIPDTLAEDQDELDAVLLSQTTFFPGCYIKCRVIGVLITEDEKGMDEKMLLVPVTEVDPSLSHIQSLEDISEQERQHIQHFFETYKKFERGKWVKITGFENKEKAIEIYQQCQQRRMVDNQRKGLVLTD